MTVGRVANATARRRDPPCETGAIVTGEVLDVCT
jgi:hypothetical protein